MIADRTSRRNMKGAWSRRACRSAWGHLPRRQPAIDAGKHGRGEEPDTDCGSKRMMADMASPGAWIGCTVDLRRTPLLLLSARAGRSPQRPAPADNSSVITILLRCKR
jgi:hypothetical protein